MDVKAIEAAAKKEALGWIELEDEPVPVTKEGLIRVAKRMVFFVPVLAVFAVMVPLKVLGFVPVL